MRRAAMAQLQGNLRAQKEELRGFRKELDSRSSVEAQRVQTERSRLERKRGHLRLDMEHLEQAEAQLKAEASKRTAPFVGEREQLVIFSFFA